MRTKLWMFGVAVAALTSCTNNEVTEIAENRAIKFDAFVDNASRALDVITYNNIASIWVFGYSTTTADDYTTNKKTVFDNVPVSKSNGAWTYSTPQYWTTNTKYRFAAYAHGTTTMTAESQVKYDPVNDQVVFTDYVASPTNSHDLVAAIAGDRNVSETLDATSTAAIPFNFKHMLSRVSFTFTDAANVYLQIENLKITNAANKGTGTLSYNDGNHEIKWTLSTTDTGYTYTSPLSPNPTTPAVDEQFVIPQSTTDLIATFSVVTYQDENCTSKINSYNYEVSLNATNVTEWKPGYVYNYHAVFGSSFNEIPITFNVTAVEQWITDIDSSTEDDDIDVTPNGAGSI